MIQCLLPIFQKQWNIDNHFNNYWLFNIPRLRFPPYLYKIVGHDRAVWHTYCYINLLINQTFWYGVSLTKWIEIF